MADFELFETNFSPMDETINFGSKTIESEKLFEVCTLSTFKTNDSAGVSSVVINTIAKNGYLYFSNGNTLKIFNGQTLSGLVTNISLSSDIITMAISSDDKLLATCLDTGVIELLKIDKKQECFSIYSKCLGDNKIPLNVYSISEYDNHNVTSFLAIFRDGTMYRISAKQEENNFQVDTKELVNLSCKLNLSYFHYPVVAAFGSSCYIIDVETKDVITDLSFKIKKITLLGYKFLCLDYEGKLWRLCELTLKMFPVNCQFLLDDILVLQDKTKILAVTKPNEIGEFFLKLLDTDIEQVFSLKLYYPVYLININSNTDDILFMSFITNDSQKIIEIRLQTVYEVDPVARMNKLIQKQRFEEAEEFAKKFNLDMTCILKAKAQYIVDTSECNSVDINELISLMDKIDDSYFKLYCCTSIDCWNFEDVKKILSYGYKISPKSGEKRKEEILTFKKTVMDLLFRWETFMALSKENDDIQAWQRFSVCNLLEKVNTCLDNYYIQDAVLIYNRMDENTIKLLNEEYISVILYKLDQIPQDLYQAFLPSFFTVTMTHLPKAMHLFLNWLHYKILSFFDEKKDKFLENSITMAEGILKLIRVENDNGISVLCMLNRQEIENLSHLIKGLHLLLKLKLDYSISVELTEYLKGMNNFISTLLKLPMQSEVYEEFLKNFLYPYMLENKIEPDEIFEEEINSLLDCDESWMPTIEVIVKNMSCLERKLNIIIQKILVNGKIPWCNVTKKIGLYALQFSHPMVDLVTHILNNEAKYAVIKKYSIKFKNLDCEMEFRRIIHRIIYLNEPEMIDDIYYLCRSDSDHITANLILVDNFILKGQLEHAMSILDKNKKEIVYLCATQLLFEIETNIEQCHRAEEKEKYYNALPEVLKRFINNAPKDKEYEKSRLVAHFRLVKGLYEFNQKFETNFTPLDIEQNYKKLIEIVASNVDFVSLGFEEVLKQSEQLAFFLSKERDEVLLQLCDNVKNYEILINTGEYLMENESSAKNLYLITTLLLKYLGVQEYSLSNSLSSNIPDQTLPTFSILGSDDDSSGSETFLQGLKLGEKLITKALMKDDCNILQVQELLNWIQSCFFLTKQPSTLRKKLYNNIYCSKETEPNNTLLRSVRSCYLGYIHSKVTKYDFNSEYHTFILNMDDPEEVRSSLDDLPSTINTFFRYGHYFTAFALVKTLLNSLILSPTKDEKILKHLERLIGKSLPYLISDVISTEYIDIEFLYHLLLASGPKYLELLVHYLKTNKRNYRKLNDISTVGIKLLDLHKETVGRDVMVKSVKQCKWWDRLKPVHSKLVYEEFFKSSDDNRLKKLIIGDLVRLKDIAEYCEEYNLSSDEYYKEYLRNFLVNYKPEYEIREDLSGKKLLSIKSDEYVYNEECQKILNVIKDKQGVLKIMEKILLEVNFYHYEVFSIIYKYLSINNKPVYSRYYKMLQFLKYYQRCSAPSQREKEEWYKRFPDSQLLDPLSEFRFPFSMSLFNSDIWSILRPEVNFDSYKLWFTAATILTKKCLNIDDICCYAVKQVVSSGILGDCSSKDWIFYSKFDDILTKVDKCVQHITDFERATSVVYHLMTNIPNGIDKVKAAGLCFKYALQYKEKNVDDPEVESAFIKIKNKYYGLNVCNVLHMFNLAKESYLELVTHPETLIEKLYMDERILKDAESLSLGYSDINSAVDALSEIFELDIQQIRLNLLNGLLNDSHFKFDMSFMISESNSSMSQIGDEDNLKRAVYLCTSGDKVYLETYLLRVGLEEDADADQYTRSFAFKANALKCFCAIADEASIVQSTNLTYKEFLYHVKRLALLAELEQLGFSLDIERLNGVNKREFLKKLSRMGKPLAIKCMGMICVIYDIDEDRYWEYIINTSIKLEMIPELNLYLDYLKNKCDKPYYILAWQVMINKRFQQLTHIHEKDLEEALSNDFLMIQSCPVAFSLNFEKIVDILINVNKNEYIVILLGYMTEDQRAKVKMDLLKDNINFSKLNKLRSKGLWCMDSLIKNNFSQNC